MWTILYYLRHPYAGGLQRLLDVEWTEGSRATWPHCCTQARCWMHYSPATRWCDCSCLWCRLARRYRAAAGERPRWPGGVLDITGTVDERADYEP